MAGMQESVCVCMCPFMSMCFERERHRERGSSYAACMCVIVRLCSFGTCNTICEGNRKLLEWMRGKQCDMRQVGGGWRGNDGRMDGVGRDEGGGGCCQHAVA